MDLPESVQHALEPLFKKLPPDQAMAELTPKDGAAPDLVQAVEEIMSSYPELGRTPQVMAGLWLYIDELTRSHSISQGIENATGSFWHGIMHRREGDFGNSHYWFRRTGQHPAMANIPDYDPHAFIDAAAARHQENPPELVALQRREWQELFAWCVAEHLPRQ